MQWIKVILAAWIIGSVGGAAIKNIFSIGFDDTDTDAWNRSGMRVYTDAKTGVQYLGTARGGLAVRVDKNGNPL